MHADAEGISSASGMSWSSGGIPPLDHDLGYVDGGVADLLYVLDDLEDSRHLFRVSRTPRGQDGQGAHVEDQVVETLLQVGTSSERSSEL